MRKDDFFRQQGLGYILPSVQWRVQFHNEHPVHPFVDLYLFLKFQTGSFQENARQFAVSSGENDGIRC